MSFRVRELAELRRIHAEHLPPGHVVPMVVGSETEIDLCKINVPAMQIAQARVLGAMLDELLTALKPPAKPKAAARKTASKATRRR